MRRCYVSAMLKLKLLFISTKKTTPTTHFFHIYSSDKIKNQRTEGTEESAIKKTFVKEAVLV